LDFGIKLPMLREKTKK